MSAGGPVLSVALEAEIARLKADLATAEALVAKSAEKMGQTVKKNGIMSSAMSELKSTVRTVGDALNYAQVGIGSVVALSETMRGNFEASQQALERLPNVFGEAARFGRMLFESIVGTAQTMKAIADAEAEVAQQGAFRERASKAQSAIAEYEFQTAMMRESDPVARIQMQRDREMEKMRAEYKRRGDESGKRFAEEMAKIREEEMARPAQIPGGPASGVADPTGLIGAVSGKPVDQELDRLRVRRAAASAQLKRDAEVDLREMEAAAVKISTEFQAKLDAAYKARGAGKRREELQSEEESLRRQLRTLGSVNPRDFITSADTAIGAFTTAQGNASAMLSKNISEQLAVQKKIEENTREQAELLQAIRDSGGGWQ